MAELKELFQAADWKTEKHVPVIEAPESVKKGEFFRLNVIVGKAAAHPNTAGHHLNWIDVYFLPQGEKFPVQIARTDFLAHGCSTQGPETSTVYTGYETQISFKTDKPGTIFASSYCNIHGLWQSSKELKVI